MANPLRGGRGRPLHPAIVHFPLALYPVSLLFDGISYLVEDGNPFVKGAFTLLLVALAFSVIAMLTGFTDFLLVPAGGSAWRVGVIHMTCQLVGSGLFLANTILRARDLDVTTSPLGPVVLSAAGVVIIWVGGQFGRDLVFRHGLRVEIPNQPTGVLDPDPQEPPSAQDEHPARP
jgi:uncharacterized membrane protein